MLPLSDHRVIDSYLYIILNLSFGNFFLKFKKKSLQDLSGILNFLNSRFVNNPVIRMRHAHPTVPGSFGAGCDEELRKFTLKKVYISVKLKTLGKQSYNKIKKSRRTGEYYYILLKKISLYFSSIFLIHFIFTEFVLVLDAGFTA